MSFELIKISIRNNLLYPFLFMLGINLLRAIRIIFFEIAQYKKLNIIFSLLTFSSNIFFSIYFIYFGLKRNKPTKKSIIGIKLIQRVNEEHKKIIIDSDKKILFLIFSDAYFEFMNTIRKDYLLRLKPYKTELGPLDIRIRSREILFASLICYFTIGLKFNKHHIISLLIIFFCVITLYIFEVSCQFSNDYYENLLEFLILQGFKILINIARVFSDVIERYLFDYNNVSPFKILLLKGIIEVILMLIYILSYVFNDEFHYLFNNNKIENNKFYLFISIILIIIYLVVSGFTSIYKMYTVKSYTPMTRTLSDIMLDSFFWIYFSSPRQEKDKKKQIKSFYFFFNYIGQLITLLFNFVYNEFIILNFWGLGNNTHYEIARRASNIELYSPNNINNNDNQSENSDNSFNEDFEIVY